MKFVAAIETDPSILNYFGISETTIKNEVEFTEKYEKIKVI